MQISQITFFVLFAFSLLAQTQSLFSIENEHKNLSDESRIVVQVGKPSLIANPTRDKAGQFSSSLCNFGGGGTAPLGSAEYSQCQASQTSQAHHFSPPKFVPPAMQPYKFSPPAFPTATYKAPL